MQIYSYFGEKQKYLFTFLRIFLNLQKQNRSIYHDFVSHQPLRPHPGLPHLRKVRGEGLRTRSGQDHARRLQGGRSRLHSHAGLEGLYDPVPQHRGHGPHLRCHNGREVRPFGLPLDRLRMHLRRSRTRLPFGNDVPQGRRSEPPGARRQVPGQGGKECNALLHRPASGAGRRRFRIQPRHHPRRHRGNGRQRHDYLDDDLGGHHSRILPHRHPAAHRQDHRQDIPHLRICADIHGCRSFGRPYRQVALHPRILGRAAEPRALDRDERTVALPLPLHHHRLRRHQRLPRHSEPDDGPLHEE